MFFTKVEIVRRRNRIEDEEKREVKKKKYNFF